MTVSIVTYHTNLDEMQKCLASLDCAEVEDIFVIDNSNDELMREFCKGYPKVRYIASENVGYGRAHNMAIRQSLTNETDYHLVLNSDVRFAPEIIGQLKEYMDANPDVGIVQPRLTYSDGRNQSTARLLPTPLDVLGRRFLPKTVIRRRNDRYTLNGIPDTCDADVPYLQGSFLFVRCSCLRQIGLFDERFFMYPEDIDLCRRVWSVARVVRHPLLTIVHDHRAGSYHSYRLLRIHCINMIKYFCKWGWFVDPARKRINSHCRKRIFEKIQ